MANTPAAMPTTAPLMRVRTLTSTSALASSISSRMSSCALSETSWIAVAIEAWLPLVAVDPAVTRGACGSTAKALEDQGGEEATGERDPDEDLRTVLRGRGKRGLDLLLGVGLDLLGLHLGLLGLLRGDGLRLLGLLGRGGLDLVCLLGGGRLRLRGLVLGGARGARVLRGARRREVLGGRLGLRDRLAGG